MQEYPLNSHGQPDDLVISTLTKYAPILIGKSWYYGLDTVIEVDDDWLGGQKATLALVKERQIAVKEYRAKFAIAIVQTEQELASVV